MKIIIYSILITLLVTSLVYAGDYIVFDNEGIIIAKHYSVDGAGLDNNPNALKIPRDVFNSLTRWHKVENNQVRLMTQAEKDIILAQDEADRIATLNAQVDGLDITVKDVIIALIKVINARIPSNPITKQELITQIKQDLEL